MDPRLLIVVIISSLRRAKDPVLRIAVVAALDVALAPDLQLLRLESLLLLLLVDVVGDGEVA